MSPKPTGGNQQRLVVGRELALATDLLVAENPTRGLDVVATDFVHRQMQDAVVAGREADGSAAAVVLISTDLDEVLATMREVPPGGHFLGTAHTLANFQTAFSMPEMMNSDNYEQWLAEGALSAEERAVAKCRQMLDDYEEPALPDDVAAELEDFVARRDAELPDTVR